MTFHDLPVLADDDEAAVSNFHEDDVHEVCACKHDILLTEVSKRLCVLCHDVPPVDSS
jgi:hypothetical protein